jgi:hypothetical protein
LILPEEFRLSESPEGSNVQLVRFYSQQTLLRSYPPGGVNLLLVLPR